MSGNNGHEASSMYYCIDESLEQVKSSGTCEDVHLVYSVHTNSGSLLHIPNSGSQELPCVVCTK